MPAVTRLLILVALTLAAAMTAGSAHEIRPAIVTADVSEPGRYTLTISANLEAMLAGIGAEHKDTNDAPGASEYNTLRALPPAQLRARFEAFAPRLLQEMTIAFDGTRVETAITSVVVPDGVDPALARISTVTLTGPIAAGTKTFRWAYPSRLGTSVLRVRRSATADLETGWLKDGASSASIPLAAAAAKSKFRVLFEYIGLGFTHILPLGLDHILFVLGLFLLSTNVRPLLVQVTAFTVAHSITLALGLYGVLSISPKIVEPMIALSIVFIAVENLFTAKLNAWRPFVVFGFGLLHGLGFAGVLHELGLPRDQYLLGLTGFNIGVELGQLAIITLAFCACAYWFRHQPWYRSRIVRPASAAIAMIGFFWTIERIWFT